MESIDGAIQAGGRAQEDRRAGQMNFFGGLQNASAAVSQTPNVPDWQESLKLKYEKESLGFYVTSHPLAKYKEELRTFSTSSMDALKAAPDGAEVIVGCMLHNVKFKLSRAGKKMAQLDAEDLTGSSRCVVFPSALEKVGRLLANDSAVFIRAKVDNKAEEPCLLISEIIPIEKAYERLARSVNVVVDTANQQEETLYSLREVVAAHPGRCPLYIHFRNGAQNVSIRAGRGFHIEPTRAAIQELSELLGAENVSAR
jgi:DNA polymerase-3 subunit alpha